MAFIHTLRIALDGEGIESYLSDADRLFIGISAGPTVGSSARLYVLNEADWDQAVALMRMLDESSDERIIAPLPANSRPPLKWLIGVFAAIVGASLLAVLSH